MLPVLHSSNPAHCAEYAARAATAEITTFSDVIVVYKFLGDLMFYVTGAQDENELILYQVLQGFYESISLLLRCDAPAHPNVTVVCPPCLLGWSSGKQPNLPTREEACFAACLAHSCKGRSKSVKAARLTHNMQRNQASVTQHFHFVQILGNVHSLRLIACVQRGCGEEDGAGEPGPGAAGHGRDRGRRVRPQHALCISYSNQNVTACGLLISIARWPSMFTVCRLILETDPSTIASRVAMRGADTDVPLTEQVRTYACLYVKPMACLLSLCLTSMG